MEMSLHRELKTLYAGPNSRCEVRLGSYRIDVISDDQLVEIQYGSLAAIRRKVGRLLADGHRLRIVKPVVRRKLLVQLAARNGPEMYRRFSPHRGRWLDAFSELVFLVGVFPHPQLALEIVECDVVELRYPRRMRRRRPWSRRYAVQDQRLLEVCATYCFEDRASLLRVLPPDLPRPFHTGQLAAALSIPRWLSQKIVYVLRHSGAIETTGKLGNSRLYHIRAA